MRSFFLRYLFLAALSPLPTLAKADDWYCTLHDDPTIWGGKVMQYRLSGNKLQNVTEKRDDEQTKKVSGLDFSVGDYDVLRSSDAIIVAERNYTWKPGINIEILTIRKDDGAFTSTLLHTAMPYTEKAGEPARTLHGSCSRGG